MNDLAKDKTSGNFTARCKWHFIILPVTCFEKISREYKNYLQFQKYL